jgi:hypothetical protein
MIRKLFPGLILSLIVFPAAVAGTVLELENRDLRGRRAGSIDRLYAQGEMLRIETGAGGGSTVIFRDEALLLLNAEQKTYSRIDEAAAEAMGARMNAAMQQMEAQLKSLPAEQRAMAERMMKGRMPDAESPPEIKVEQEGSEKVGEYQCKKFVVYQDGTKSAEVFTAEVEAAGDGMGAFQAMARFATKLLASFQNTPMAEMANHPLRLLDQVEGFPVLSREFQDGEAVREVTLKSAVRKDLDAGLFSPPPGYTEADLLMGR